MKHTLVTIGKVSEYLIYGFLVAVLFIILSPRLPTKNILRTYIVPTGSMTPTVLAGSVVVVNPKETTPKIGDIVAFLSPRDTTETILHRVTEKTDQGYKTKGDFNNTNDNWIVPAKNIQGTLVVAIPYVGHVAAFVKKPLGFVLLAVIPALMLGVASLLDIKNGIEEEYKKHKKKKTSTLVAAALLFFVLGFAVAQHQAKSVYAAFLAEAKIEGISISAAFPSSTPVPTTTPTPTPSATPSPTPSHTPSPTPHGNCPVNIEIEGNGEGSINEVHVSCITTKVVIQFNHLFSIHHIHYEFDYDSDEGKQGVLGDIAPDGETVITKDVFKGNCSNNVCTPNHNTKNDHLKLKFE